MKKILIGLVLVALVAVAALAFFGGCSSAPKTSSTPAAEYSGGITIPDPTPVGVESITSEPSDEDDKDGGSGSCSPSLFLGKIGLQNWSPVFWIILAIWGMTQIIPGRWDDYILYGGSIAMLLLAWAGGGCMGDYNPFSPWWWLFECVWVIYGINKLKKTLKERPLLKWLLVAVGWYLLGVFS